MTNQRLAPKPAFLPYEPTPRQKEILERTFELVQESGLAGLTLKKVAERVGFTEAAIYRHFPNKSALLDGLLCLLGSRLLTPVYDIAGNESVPPASRLEQIVRHHVGILRATSGLPMILVAEGLATGDHLLLTRLESILGAYAAVVASLLDRLRLPVAAPTHLQATLFLGLPAALGLRIRAQPDFVFEDREIEALVRYYVGRLTQPAAREESA